MSGSISTIQQFFTNILERPVDPGGLTTFTNEASSGVPLDAIENQIATSTEAAKFVTPIVQLYEGILGRNPEQVGLNFWVNLYRSGNANLTQIANAFATTPEGAAVLGNAVSTASVTALYKASLNRTPTTTEVNGWIATGLPLAQVAASIATSAEATVNLAAASLSYLLAAGQVQQTTSGQTIPISGQQATYTGTTGNDIFLAPVTQAPLTGLPLASLLNNTVIKGNGGSDVLQAGVTGGTALTSNTVAPTLTGIQTVQVTGSPGATEFFDLSNTTGVTETDLTNSSNATIFYTNATTVAGASLSNSNNGNLNVNSVAGSPVAAVSIANSNGGALNVTNDTSTALAATVTSSPNSALTVGSLKPNTGLTTLTVNATAGTSSAAGTPDTLKVTDTDAVLKGLLVNDSTAGFERITLAGSALLAGSVTISNIGTTATTGQLSLAGTFTNASTVDASAFTGNLQNGATVSALAAAEGSTVPTTYAGVTSSLAGLVVAGDPNLTSVKTGSGSSVVDLSGEATPKAAFTFTGTGNNVVLLGNNVTTNGTFAGGSGANVIGITNGATTTSGDTFSGFQTLEIGPNANGVAGGPGGAGTYNLAALGGLTTVAVTGDKPGDAAQAGAVTLNNTPDNLNVVETAYPGVGLATANPLTVLLGAGSTSANVHTVNLTLNADGGSADTNVAAPGVVTTGLITIGQLGNGSASATFLPGYSETVNLASNIFNPGGTAVAGSYTNTIGGMTATNATSIKVSGAANLKTGVINASGNLTTFDASKETGAITTTINEGTQTASFAYTGSSGVDNVAYNATPGAGAKFTNTFVGGGGNDTITVNDSASNGGVTNTFNYSSATDAILADNNPQGILLSDVGTTLSVETINGFTPGTPAAKVDSLNFQGLGISNANVLIGGATGSNIGLAGFLPGPSLTGNIATVAGLYNSASTEELYTAQTNAFSNAPPAGSVSAGAFVYQAADQSVYIFADVNKDGNFAATSDLAIHLTGAFSASQVNAIATDIKFG